MSEEARAVAIAFAHLAAPRWRPPTDQASRLPEPAPPAGVLAAYGLQPCGPLAVPVASLERLDAHLRETPTVAGAVTLTPDALIDLGWDEATARTIMRSLDFAPARKTAAGAPSFWRLRRERMEAAAPKPLPLGAPSPFAALAALKAPPPRKRRARRPRRAARPAA